MPRFEEDRLLFLWVTAQRGMLPGLAPSVFHEELDRAGFCRRAFPFSPLSGGTHRAEGAVIPVAVFL